MCRCFTVIALLKDVKSQLYEIVVVKQIFTDRKRLAVKFNKNITLVYWVFDVCVFRYKLRISYCVYYIMTSDHDERAANFIHYGPTMIMVCI